MSVYTEFFLNSSAAVAELETLEISHPDFSRVYRIVRNAVGGVTATLETSAVVAFEYYPCRVERLGNTDSLDQDIKITLGDVGDTMPNEIARVISADSFSVYPTLTYRTYRSDNLTVPLFGPILLYIAEVAQAAEGAVLTAIAPRANNAKTGEIYSLDRFPMLRGLL